MPTEALFRSSAFNTTEVRDYFINDCCFGDDLGKWLIAKLRAAGIETDDEPDQEDFGWFFNFKVPVGEHCCILAFQEDEPEGIWHLTLERKRGLLGSMFGGRSKGIDEVAVAAITKALEAAPEIRELRWEEKVA